MWSSCFSLIPVSIALLLHPTLRFSWWIDLSFSWGPKRQTIRIFVLIPGFLHVNYLISPYLVGPNLGAGSRCAQIKADHYALVTIIRLNKHCIDVNSIYYHLVWRNKLSTHDFRMKYKNGNGKCQLSEIHVSFQQPLIGPPTIRATQIKSAQIRADKVVLFDV